MTHKRGGESTMKLNRNLFLVFYILLSINMGIRSGVDLENILTIPRQSLDLCIENKIDLNAILRSTPESNSKQPLDAQNKPSLSAIFKAHFDDISSHEDENRRESRKQKKWTVLLYMAADNDLYPFASQNLAQLKEIGSNKFVNILVHLDIKIPGKEKVTKRLFIDKNKIMQIGPDMRMNSGSQETLTSAVLWGLADYPSDKFALIFWNHGSGDLNPVLRKTVNPAYLFRYNPDTSMIELDRSIGFLEFIDMIENGESDHTTSLDHRGICFDETFRAYLDDDKLMGALTTICNYRNGKKLDLVIFDACLMAGTGTAWIMSQFANYMVASEEVVLGPGYNYRVAMRSFADGEDNPYTIAKNLVESYEQTYTKITNDYTHSAFDLSLFDQVNNNIDILARLLIEALNEQKDMSVRNIIKACRSRYSCTFFDEPSYIDLFHFYANLRQKVNLFQFTDKNSGEEIRNAITKTLDDGLALSQEFIIANACGTNLARAQGISIYFPEFKINNAHHASYQYTQFAQNNSWPEFLRTYLALA